MELNSGVLIHVREMPAAAACFVVGGVIFIQCLPLLMTDATTHESLSVYADYALLIGEWLI